MPYPVGRRFQAGLSLDSSSCHPDMKLSNAHTRVKKSVRLEEDQNELDSEPKAPRPALQAHHMSMKSPALLQAAPTPSLTTNFDHEHLQRAQFDEARSTRHALGMTAPSAFNQKSRSDPCSMSSHWQGYSARPVTDIEYDPLSTEDHPYRSMLQAGALESSIARGWIAVDRRHTREHLSATPVEIRSGPKLVEISRSRSRRAGYGASMV